MSIAGTRVAVSRLINEQFEVRNKEGTAVKPVFDSHTGIFICSLWNTLATQKAATPKPRRVSSAFTLI